MKRSLIRPVRAPWAFMRRKRRCIVDDKVVNDKVIVSTGYYHIDNGGILTEVVGEKFQGNIVGYCLKFNLGRHGAVANFEFSLSDGRSPKAALDSIINCLEDAKRKIEDAERKMSKESERLLGLYHGSV